MAPSVGWRYHISALLHHAFWLQDQGSWALSVEPSLCRQSVEHRESSLTIDAGQMHIILPKARAGSMPRTCWAGSCQFSRCSSSSKGDNTHSHIDARHDSVLPFCHHSFDALCNDGAATHSPSSPRRPVSLAGARVSQDDHGHEPRGWRPEGGVFACVRVRVPPEYLTCTPYLLPQGVVWATAIPRASRAGAVWVVAEQT